MSKQQDLQKQQAAKKALDYIQTDTIVGIGTGSTVDFFIEELVAIKHDLAGVVASSNRSKEKLLQHGFDVLDINSASHIDVYVDGADEVTHAGYAIKGGGGAQTLEKLVASISKSFICIVDESKLVDRLGVEFPLALEVLPYARSYVGRECVKLGANPVYRDGFVTDCGNIILDVYGLNYSDLSELNNILNNIVGVVGHGLFIKEKADKILVASDDKVVVIDPR